MSDNGTTEEEKPIIPKWADLEYRIRACVHPAYLWMRCQVGRVHIEKRGPKLPAEPVFELLGYGSTMIEAEEMAEKKLGRS